MGQPPQSTVDWDHPPRIVTFALGYPLANGLIMRSREITTETPAQCIMERPAWGKDGCHLAPLDAVGHTPNSNPFHTHTHTYVPAGNSQCQCNVNILPPQPSELVITPSGGQQQAWGRQGREGWVRWGTKGQRASSWELNLERWGGDVSLGSKSSDTPSIVPSYIIYTNLNLNTNTNSKMKQLRISRQGL